MNSFMINGASQLSTTVPVALLPTRPLNAAAPAAALPVILCATEAEAKGARVRVGGLRVVF